MKRVLVVEDDPNLRTVIRIVLEPMGYQVVEAIHGADALNLMSAGVPDIVLADLKMPVMDGYELVRRMRTHRDLMSVPVVIITGRSEAKYSGELGDFVLVKPFEARDLVNAIERLTQTQGQVADS